MLSTLVISSANSPSMSSHGSAQESLVPSGGNICRNQIPKTSYLFVNFVNFYYLFSLSGIDIHE